MLRSRNLIVALLALLWCPLARSPQPRLRVDQSAPIVETRAPNDDGNFAAPLRAVFVEITPDQAPHLVVRAQTRTATLATSAGNVERTLARNRAAIHQLLSLTYFLRAAASGMESNRTTTVPPPIL
jgi:hypothetical protein